MDKLITHRFPLDDIQTAFEIAMTGADNYIKGVIIP
jgi:threonine dehydrogenase-like Zn-dependent dehydrogenase